MPTAHDNSSELDAFKTPIYKLCEVLVRLRRSPQGYGLRTAMNVPLEELHGILQYDHDGTREQKIEKLRERFLFLSNEMIPSGNELRPMVFIHDEYIHDTNLFREQFVNNGVLRLTYTSRDLEEYQQELTRRTQEQHSATSDITLTPQSSGGIILSKGTKEMRVRRGRDGRNLSASIICLMWGHSVELPTGPVSMDDYERGDFIGYDRLMDELRSISGDENNPEMIARKAVVSAVTRLNTRAEQESVFGKPIFETNDDGLKWVL